MNASVEYELVITHSIVNQQVKENIQRVETINYFRLSKKYEQYLGNWFPVEYTIDVST